MDSPGDTTAQAPSTPGTTRADGRSPDELTLEDVRDGRLTDGPSLAAYGLLLLDRER